MTAKNLTKFPFPQNLFHDLYGLYRQYNGYTGYRLLRICNLSLNADDLFVLIALYQRRWTKAEICRYLGKSHGYADMVLVRTFNRLREHSRRSLIWQPDDGSFNSFAYHQSKDGNYIPDITAASDIDIDIFDISGKSFTSLLYAGIENVNDIICTPKYVFELLPNISREDFDSIHTKIIELGFDYASNIFIKLDTDRIII